MRVESSLFGVLTRSRPTTSDAAVRALAVDALYEQIQRWHNDNGQSPLADDDEDVRKSLDDIIHMSDAYRMARELEYDGWTPDAELVEILDSPYLSHACDRAVRDWVVEQGFKLSLPIGTHVSTKVKVASPLNAPAQLNREADITGVIVRRDDAEARYIIFFPDLNGGLPPPIGEHAKRLGVLGIYVNAEDVESDNGAYRVVSVPVQPS